MDYRMLRFRRITNLFGLDITICHNLLKYSLSRLLAASACLYIFAGIILGLIALTLLIIYETSKSLET